MATTKTPTKTRSTTPKGKAKTSTTNPKSNGKAKTPAKAQPKNCTLTIKPDILKHNLGLLTAGVNANQQVLDRLVIAVGDNQCVFRVGVDVSVSIKHKARKGLTSEPVQISCKQIKDFAGNIDKTNQKLELSSESVTINNQRSTYRQSFISYKDNLPQDDVVYTPTATVEAAKLKAGLQDILPFVSTDAKQIISGVCLEIKPDDSDEILQLRLTGRSEDCFSTVTLPAKAVETDDINPLEPISLVVTKKLAGFLMNYADNHVTLSVGENSVRFEWDNVECSAKTLKGKYPDVDKTLEQIQNNDIDIEFNREDLYNALKRQKINSAEIEFKVKDENCDLIHATETGSGVERIFCSNESGEDLKLDLYIDYLIKIVSLIKSDTISFKLDLEPEEGEDSPSNPVLIEHKNTVYCLPQLIEGDEDEDEDEDGVGDGDEDETVM